MPEEEDKSDDLISQFVDGLDPGAMVTKFVVIAEGIDPQGERAVYTATHENANSWDVMGLLKYAMTREESSMVADYIEENGED